MGDLAMQVLDPNMDFVAPAPLVLSDALEGGLLPLLGGSNPPLALLLPPITCCTRHICVIGVQSGMLIKHG